MSEQLVPQLRFREFNGAWSSEPLLNCAVVGNGRDYKHLGPGPVPVFGTGGLITTVSDALSFKDAVGVGRKGTIDKPYVLRAPFWTVDTLFFVTPKAKVDIQFLFGNCLRIDWKSKAESTGVPSLSKTAIEQSTIALTGIAEQRKVGVLLSNVDATLSLHERKHRQLQQAKASLMQRMFPAPGANEPEIRFEGFSGKWEQRRLGDVATFINGRAYSQPELLSHGKYPVLRVGNFYTNSAWYYSDLELNEKFYANTGDLLYTWSASFGPHIWTGGKVIFHYHIWRVELSNALDKLFVLQLLEKHRDSILAGHNGSTMAHITKEGMEDKSVLLAPSVAEQQAVGAFFSKLDDLIEAQAQYVSKLQQVKAALLQKMFI